MECKRCNSVGISVAGYFLHVLKEQQPEICTLVHMHDCKVACSGRICPQLIKYLQLNIEVSTKYNDKYRQRLSCSFVSLFVLSR